MGVATDEIRTWNDFQKLTVVSCHRIIVCMTFNWGNRKPLTFKMCVRPRHGSACSKVLRSEVVVT